MLFKSQMFIFVVVVLFSFCLLFFCLFFFFCFFFFFFFVFFLFCFFLITLRNLPSDYLMQLCSDCLSWPFGETIKVFFFFFFFFFCLFLDYIRSFLQCQLISVNIKSMVLHSFPVENARYSVDKANTFEINQWVGCLGRHLSDVKLTSL